MNSHLRIDGLRKAILVSALLLTSVAALWAQGTGPGGYVMLRPRNTGREVVTFNPGGSRTSSRDSRSSPANSRALSGGRFAIKTDIAYGIITQTPNLAFEYSVSPHSSIEATAGYNNWNSLWDYSKNGPAYDPTNRYKRRFNHFFVKAEYRYWLRGALDGHYVSGGAFFAKYRVGDFNFFRILDLGHDYFGKLFGINFSYGYLWKWSERWGTEFSIGLGAASVRHDKSVIMISDEGGFTLANPVREKRVYVGPTGIAIRMVFTIK